MSRKNLGLSAIVVDIWNVISCSVLLILREAQPVKEKESDNFFCVKSSSTILLVNLVFCFLTTIGFPSKVYQRHGLGQSILKSIIIFFSVILISILFGAPIHKDLDRTSSFSLTITALLLPSVVFSHKLDSSLGKFFELDWITSNELSPLIGAWLGASVIPLDWDRPWQVWPEPCCVGAVLGCLGNHLFKLIGIGLASAGYHVYWPTRDFVHERRV